VSRISSRAPPAPDPADIKAAPGTLAQHPSLDRKPLLAAQPPVQQLRCIYTFPSGWRVDRYALAMNAARGDPRQVLDRGPGIDSGALRRAPRHLVEPPSGLHPWLCFTVSAVNTFGPDGLPFVFLFKDLGRSGRGAREIEALGIR